jgi:hypothetical protein
LLISLMIMLLMQVDQVDDFVDQSQSKK